MKSVKLLFLNKMWTFISHCGFIVTGLFRHIMLLGKFIFDFFFYQKVDDLSICWLLLDQGKVFLRFFSSIFHKGILQNKSLTDKTQENFKWRRYILL